MRLKSKDFEDNSNIPSEFTCDGRDVSPQLSWEDVPAETKSFALSVTDPDAPMGTWIHWLVHDIPKDVRTIAQGGLPEGAKQVENDFRMKEYGGPCPPSGTQDTFSPYMPLTSNIWKALTNATSSTRLGSTLLTKRC